MIQCICGLDPDRDRSKNQDDLNTLLDSRCPKHGRKAQPAVWEDRKGGELVVTPKQWEVLRSAAI